MNNMQSQQVLDDLEYWVQVFLDQLSIERELLLDGNASDLNTATAKKQEIIEKLTALEARFSPLLNNFEEHSELNEKWQKTLLLLQTCQQKNTENSALVNHRLKQTNQALHQIHCLFSHDHALTYSADGSQTISSEPNRSVHA